MPRQAAGGPRRNTPQGYGRLSRRKAPQGAAKSDTETGRGGRKGKTKATPEREQREKDGSGDAEGPCPAKDRPGSSEAARALRPSRAGTRVP